jgi:hypothetical protein
VPTPPGPPTIKISIDVGDLRIYRVIIKTAGKLPVRDLTIRLVFEQATNDFMVLTFKCETTPPYEFGEIKDDFAERARLRFV